MLASLALEETITLVHEVLFMRRIGNNFGCKYFALIEEQIRSNAAFLTS